MLNSNFTFGTFILKFIHTSLLTLRGNKTYATQVLSDFYQLKWTPPKTKLLDFNSIFNQVLSLVMETNPDFTFTQIKHAWIKALPSAFLDLQMKLNKSKLDEKWSAVDTVAELFILTVEKIQNCNINFDSNPSKPPEPKPPLTSKLVQKQPADSRSAFLDDFSTFDKLYTKVKEMVDANETQEAIETKFKTPYPYHFQLLAMQDQAEERRCSQKW